MLKKDPYGSEKNDNVINKVSFEKYFAKRISGNRELKFWMGAIGGKTRPILRKG